MSASPPRPAPAPFATCTTPTVCLPSFPSGAHSRPSPLRRTVAPLCAPRPTSCPPCPPSGPRRGRGGNVGAGRPAPPPARPRGGGAAHPLRAMHLISHPAQRARPSPRRAGRRFFAAGRGASFLPPPGGTPPRPAAPPPTHTSHFTPTAQRCHARVPHCHTHVGACLRPTHLAPSHLASRARHARGEPNHDSVAMPQEQSHAATEPSPTCNGWACFVPPTRPAPTHTDDIAHSPHTAPVHGCVRRLHKNSGLPTLADSSLAPHGTAAGPAPCDLHHSVWLHQE